MAEGKSYRVAGFEVHFPHEAYGVQKVFINQVLKAIHNEENALLEAPTGCGKTLSLLCGALAWQHAQKQKKAAAEQLRKERREAEAADAKPGTCLAPVKQNSKGPGEATSDVDEPEEPEEEIRVPKIYYATRTHSQIAQVVRELKRTAYKQRMTVLGSRPHYCINKSALRHKDGVDAACEEMLKDQQGCRFKKNAMTLSHALVKVHDIEDLAKIGSRHKACPYFASRHLAESADLIFCPYSYLLDPNIRRATKVQAADAILIFDEAHNIEDQAREAGSIDLDIDKLKKTFLGLHKASCCSSESDAYEPLKDAVLQVINWLLKLGEGGPEQGGFRSAGFERFERLWTGQQMIIALADAGLDPQATEHLWTCYEKARAAEDKAGFNTEGDAANERVSSDITTPRAGGAALGYMSSLLTALRLLYGSYSEVSSLQDEQQQQQLAAAPGSKPAVGQVPAAKAVQMKGGDHVADYRLAVHMWVDRDAGRNRGRGRDRYANNDSTAEEFAAAAPGTTSTEWSMSLGIWCLNPCVVFRCLSDVARSVLLASGTLSPLDSFSGELGLNFHVKLEAPHVVDMHRQVMARVVSHGPDGRQLCATYKEADKLDYQDSLGRLVLEVVRVVPDGVLLFLPSYVLMDKLRDRWKATGVWTEIERLKRIVAEPRKAGDEFDAAIAQYYRAVQHDSGGLFMAVCRGKASEGIDFADGNARCVIVVGIPFPNVKDSKVGLKKDFNNASVTARPGPGSRPVGLQQGPAAAGPPKLLSGDQWYSQQAFRALNQAVGRCIRHRFDYGAILLVDERFRQPRHQQCLSKWVRGAIGTAADTPKLMCELKTFFDGLEANPPAAAAAASMQQQQAAGLIKPGYEAELMQSKPGFEPGPVVGPSSSMPGYEAAAGVAGGGPGPLQDPANSRAPHKPGYEASAHGSKPGYEPAACGKPGGTSCQGLADSIDDDCCAAAGHAQNRWQASSWQRTATDCKDLPQQQQARPQMQEMRQQQQQQQEGQQRQPQLSGPMDSFVVRQQQPQPCHQQYQQQEGQRLQPPMPMQPGQQPGQQAGPQQQQHPWQQQQRQNKQPPVVKQEQHTWQHPQHLQQTQQHQPSRSDSAPKPGESSGVGGADVGPQVLDTPGAGANSSATAPAAATALASWSGTAQCKASSVPQPGQGFDRGQQQPVQQATDDVRSSRVMPLSLKLQHQHQQSQVYDQQQQQPPSWQRQEMWQHKEASGKPASYISMLNGDTTHMQHQHQQCPRPIQLAMAESADTDKATAAAGCKSPQAAVAAAGGAGTVEQTGADSIVPESPAAAGVSSPAAVQQQKAVAGVSVGQSLAPSAAACCAPVAAAATAACPPLMMPGSTEHTGGNTASAAITAATTTAASSAAVRKAAETSHTTAVACEQVQPQDAAVQPVLNEGAGPSSVAPDAAAKRTASHLCSLTTRSQLLGIPADVLRCWVTADVVAMTQQLRRQGVSETGAQGCELQQLVCFGIMGSFELATDMCQQQQQQQQGDAAASSNSYQLASFWPAWHSYMPLGLLAVATAAGQLPEQRALLAHQLQQVQGPWINIMQNKALLDNLCDIAGAYDEALDQVVEQQQQKGMSTQHQQLGHTHWHMPQHQQQQQPWQHSNASATGVQQPRPQQQQAWQGQTQSHKQRTEHNWQQRQQQAVVWPWAAATETAAAGTSVPPDAGQGCRSHDASTGAVPGPASMMQLSQSARQPKRAAHRSDKAQLAAQKRSKQLQSARLAAALPPPKVNSKNAPMTKEGGAQVQLESNDDDDFM